MSRAQRTRSNRYLSVLAAMALLLSTVTGARLAVINATLKESGQSRSLRATVVGEYGSLVGHDAWRNSEWVPRNHEVEDQYVVLFPVATAAAAKDFGFWYEVALRTQETVPDIQFVGVCGDGENCEAPPEYRGVITTLSFMDPFQMQSLAIARKEGLGLLYHGRTLARTLVKVDGERAVATELAEAVIAREAGGG